MRCVFNFYMVLPETLRGKIYIMFNINGLKIVTLDIVNGTLALISGFTNGQLSIVYCYIIIACE